MQFTTLASLSLAALAAANTVTFVSLDNVDRTMYWTAQVGLPAIPPTTVPGGQNVTVTVPNAWTGNVYAVNAGEPNVPGMLAEFAMNSWADLSFFDVSAIVAPAAVDGISKLYPANEPYTPFSGCHLFPCNTAYYQPNDVQTRATTQTDFICTLSTNGLVADRDVEEADTGAFYPREAITARGYVVPSE